MNVIFSQEAKHEKLRFIPGKVVYGFEDPDAAPFFVAAGWADETDEPADIVIGAGECNIDPATVHATGPNRGRRVLDGAAAGSGQVAPDNGVLK